MNQSSDTDTRDERLHALTECSAGTPMGKLLRRFWQPIAMSDTLAGGTARAIRVLSEELTLFRGENGSAHLIGGRCAHRCTVLHTGWVEGDQLRCMYHGWRYDGSGQCTEMPAEPHAQPERFSVAGYPVHEYGGLIFAYFGAGTPPPFELPRKDFIEDPERLRFVNEQIWDCNFFQQVENSLDATHLSFVHVWGQVSRFGEEVTTAIPEISYEETSAGIRQTAHRSASNVRISDWTFPNNNRIISPGPQPGDPWIENSVWAVPIDDERTLRFNISSVPSTDPETDRRITADRTSTFNPAHYFGDLFAHHRLPEHMGAAQLVATQDYVAIRGQGVVVGRKEEHLGASDAGIAFLRRVFLRELDAIRGGRSPKEWTRLAQSFELPTQSPTGLEATTNTDYRRPMRTISRWRGLDRDD